MTLVAIGLLCIVGFIVVGIETRLHRRKLRRNATARDAGR
jgi:hypothetical protein